MALLACALAATLLCVPAVSGIDAALGETIPLEGYSHGSPYAYLFFTGPNLPVNGAPLTDASKHADQGYFTKVQVDGEGHWSYNWRTATLDVDEGTYTVWVVNGPNDRSNLMNADYKTISVRLTKPFVSAGASGSGSGSVIVYGSMEITSVPDGASVALNGASKGKTPLAIRDLVPGTYTLTLSRAGYSDLIIQAPVTGGRVSEIAAKLIPLTATPEPTTVPATTTVVPTTPPKKAPGLLPTAAVALMLLAVLNVRARQGR